MNKYLYNKKSDGYAILFTVIIVSIISMITMGLINTAYKQIILSSVAKDSTIAFYEADVGSECALYADRNSLLDSWGSSGTFNCAGYTLSYTKNSSGNPVVYSLTPESNNSNDKCFSSVITKTTTTDSVETVISTKGYNICDKSNIRTVERAIKVTY